MPVYITTTEQGEYKVRKSGTQELLYTADCYTAAKRWARSHRYQVMGVCMLEW